MSTNIPILRLPSLHKALRRAPEPPKPQSLSEWSSPPIKTCGFACQDFMVGVGMVIIQPSTGKIVVIQDHGPPEKEQAEEAKLKEVQNISNNRQDSTPNGDSKPKSNPNAGSSSPSTTKKQKKPRKNGHCFLPRGRKDLGETLQEAVVREAFEESGYRASLFPLFKTNHQPAPPNDLDAYNRPDTEPIYMSINTWGPRYRRVQKQVPQKVENGRVGSTLKVENVLEKVQNGGEYFISWFVGYIEEDAVHHSDTGMPDEQNFQSYLVSYEDALQSLNAAELPVVQYAWHVYQRHLETVAWYERSRVATISPEENGDDDDWDDDDEDWELSQASSTQPSRIVETHHSQTKTT